MRLEETLMACLRVSIKVAEWDPAPYLHQALVYQVQNLGDQVWILDKSTDRRRRVSLAGLTFSRPDTPVNISPGGSVRIYWLSLRATAASWSHEVRAVLRLLLSAIKEVRTLLRGLQSQMQGW